MPSAKTSNFTPIPSQVLVPLIKEYEKEVNEIMHQMKSLTENANKEFDVLELSSVKNTLKQWMDPQ